MNNKGFTLVELLAVIVVLGIVTVIGTTTVLPLMSESREKAFRTEATNVLKSAENVKDLVALNQITLPATSCNNTTKMCVTIDDLIDLGYYKGNKDNYSGTVTLNKTNDVFTLNLKKNAEFAIIGGTANDYINDTADLSAVASWTEASEA